MTWDIDIGGRTFTVPPLPFKYSRVVYPICQRLSNADLPMRIVKPDAPLQLTDEEVDDLAKIVLISCQAADPSLTQEEFDELPITPPELYDAFFKVRWACGGWRVATEEDQDVQGEPVEAAEPKT